ncbi:hypothetical protein ICY20_18240 [Pseudomonas sp. P115]|uniref:hypothetical protein n=1 Tax=Pseudomonas pisciculturae TaxID=2730413 RepID=UPI0018920900|nr:hypothetical protein [Pseudomonas pisciculturae]MBF6029693.1 hypothetical protein [Pseudomonas pisciculturae]
MMRFITVILSLAVTAGCGTMPPSNRDTDRTLLLAKANDGAKSIEAESLAEQYSGDAALRLVTLYVTSKGLYAAYWDLTRGSYGLAFKIKYPEIASVENKTITIGWSQVAMLVINDIDGYQTGFAYVTPGSEVALTLKRNIAAKK